MKRKRYSTEQIVAAIKQHELGMPAAEIIRKLGLPKRTAAVQKLAVQPANQCEQLAVAPGLGQA